MTGRRVCAGRSYLPGKEIPPDTWPTFPWSARSPAAHPGPAGFVRGGADVSAASAVPPHAPSA